MLQADARWHLSKRNLLDGRLPAAEGDYTCTNLLGTSAQNDERRGQRQSKPAAPLRTISLTRVPLSINEAVLRKVLGNFQAVIVPLTPARFAELRALNWPATWAGSKGTTSRSQSRYTAIERRAGRGKESGRLCATAIISRVVCVRVCV